MMFRSGVAVDSGDFVINVGDLGMKFGGYDHQDSRGLGGQRATEG